MQEELFWNTWNDHNYCKEATIKKLSLSKAVVSVDLESNTRVLHHGYS